jgi:hypothetical protein
MDTMLIKYRPKQDHVLCVTLVLPGKPSEEQKKLKLKRSQVQLLPGTNEVTDDEWKLMKVYLARKIEAGIITTVEKDIPKSEEAPDGKAHNLKQIKGKEAVTLIKDCVNPDTLKKWYLEETRDELRLLIVKKMEELKIEVPEYNPDDDDEGKTSTESGAGATGGNASSGSGSEAGAGGNTIAGK